MEKATEIVEITLPDGQSIHAEVEVPRGGDAGFGSHRIAVDALTEDIKRINKWIATMLRETFPVSPDHLGVEFGITLTAKTGSLMAVLAEAGVTATVTIKLDWNYARMSKEIHDDE